MKIKKGKTLFVCLLLVFFSACSKKETKHYDGKALLEQKCASCHNLDMPPKTSEEEKAPPMMAVSFHVADFVKITNVSEKKPKFIAFFKDFVINPSLDKSFCDKESLQSYGLMPSQKGKVSEDEVGAIASYVYEHFNQDKFLKHMQEKLAFDALAKGEQIATSKGCFTCHDKHNSKAAPSFALIAKKPLKEILQSIQKGSKGKWKGYERMMMPSYEKTIDTKELQVLAEWIKTL